MDVEMYMIFLGIDETDPDKPILESKAGLLQIKPGAIIKIKDKLYQVKTMRQKTKTEGDVSLTMQFINVIPISAQKILNQIIKNIK